MRARHAQDFLEAPLLTGEYLDCGNASSVLLARPRSGVDRLWGALAEDLSLAHCLANAEYMCVSDLAGATQISSGIIDDDDDDDGL